MIAIWLSAGAGINNTPHLKIGFFGDYCGTMVTSDTSRTGSNGTIIRLLDYMKVLGYTHVMYMLMQDGQIAYDKTAKTWKYNNGNYTSGNAAVSFANMKKATEARGMKMVPAFECMSHVSWYISQDGSISEFPDAASWGDFCNSIPVSSPAKPHIKKDAWLFNDIAFVGNYPAVKNSGMDAIVNELLKIIRANWGKSPLGGPFPEYILVNHDEIGNYGIPYVKSPFSVSGKTLAGYSASTLLAREIAYRYKQIQEAFKATRGAAEIKMMIYGDCFSPESNGQVYNFSSTLTEIKTDAKVLSMAPDIFVNLYVMPWTFCAIDNTWKSTPQYQFAYDKRPILQKINSLGFKNIPCAGEDGPCNFSDPNWIAAEIQCTFEWARAAQMFPDCFYGYGNLHFNGFDATGASGASGFTDPILAYIEKYPYIAKSYPTDPSFFINGASYPVCPYYPGVFSGVNYLRSRNNLSLIEGTDYVIGLALRQIGKNAIGIAASWNQPAFTQYTLSGSPGGTVSGIADSLLYAFCERNDDFDVRVQFSAIPTGFKAGIMVRQDLSPSSRNIHLYFDKGNSAIQVGHRDAASGKTVTGTVALPDAGFARVVRNNQTVVCFAGPDGTSWTKLGQYSIGAGTVLVGFTSSSSNGNQGSVVFGNLSIKNN